MKTTKIFIIIAVILIMLSPTAFSQNTFWKESNKTMLTLFSQRKFSEAEKVGEETLEFAKQTYGENDSNYIATMKNLGLIYKAHGQLDRAENLFQKALELEERRLEKEPRLDERNLITYLSALADLYDSQGKYNKAESLYIRILNIQKEHNVEGSSNYWLKKVAKFYRKIGKPDKAKPLEDRVNVTQSPN